MRSRLTRYALVFFALALATVSFVSDPVQAFPTRPLEVVVTWPAGGGTDIATRIVTQQAATILGRDINVVNIAGGGGAIGYVEAARRRADGYNLVSLQFDILSIEAQGLAPVSYRDFDTIALFATQPIVLVASASSGIETVDDFIRVSREMEGKLNVGGASIAGVWHQGAVLIANELGTPFNYVPMSGVAELLPALLGGHLDVGVGFLTGMEAYVQNGDIRVLAVAAAERIPDVPDVPTFLELGYDVQYAGFYGIGAPKGVPPAVLSVLEDAFRQAFEEARDELSGRALTPYYLSGQEFADYLERLYPVVESVMAQIEAGL